MLIKVTLKLAVVHCLYLSSFAEESPGDVSGISWSGSKGDNPHTVATNVHGEELSKCSLNGMALTGFTRTGYCVDEDDDKGSHHICIDLSSTASTGQDFCMVTGQDDWCADEMECDGKSGQCPVKNWCVCQWAFEGYIEKAGGCDSIQEIVCDSINQKAIEAYEADLDKHGKALECLKKRCGLDEVKETIISDDISHLLEIPPVGSSSVQVSLEKQFIIFIALWAIFVEQF